MSSQTRRRREFEDTGEVRAPRVGEWFEEKQKLQDRWDSPTLVHAVQCQEAPRYGAPARKILRRKDANQE